MFKFDKTDLQRIAVSGLGAIIVSAVSIVGVAGPVRAAAPMAISAPTK